MSQIELSFYICIYNCTFYEVLAEHFRFTSEEIITMCAMHLVSYTSFVEVINNIFIARYGSCTHTLRQDRPWIRVDLSSEQARRIIDNIVVYNRDDCCGMFNNIVSKSYLLVFSSSI